MNNIKSIFKLKLTEKFIINSFFKILKIKNMLARVFILFLAVVISFSIQVRHENHDFKLFGRNDRSWKEVC